MAPESEFKWVHLSDLHVGMSDQDWLWPTFKRSLYDDLKRLHDRVGAWDTIIFSGDLTQRGARAEFDKLDAILGELWGQSIAILHRHTDESGIS
jgi:3',5'-cyclic AMP phosphodiesterase CpdA